MKETGNVRVMQGNAAALEGALLAGCRFFAGYPITPASELAELAALRMPEVGGVYIQMEDEIASINVLAGASWGGLKVMTATSGPGFSLMQEGIGYVAITQTPCVIVDVMRGGPAIGQATSSSQQDVMQMKYGSHGEYELIVLVPSSAQECLDMTIRAFNLSEKYLVPVVVLSDEIVGHTREAVTIPEKVEVVDRPPPPPGPDFHTFRPEPANDNIPYRPHFGQGYNLLVEPQLHDENGNRRGHDPEASALCIRRTLDKIRNNVESIVEVEMENVDDADTIFVAYGSTARSAQRAAREARKLGRKAGFVRLKTLFPFADHILKPLAREGVRFVVPEMNSGKICKEVQRATGAPVLSIPKLGGEMPTPTEILAAAWE